MNSWDRRWGRHVAGPRAGGSPFVTRHPTPNVVSPGRGSQQLPHLSSSAPWVWAASEHWILRPHPAVQPCPPTLTQPAQEAPHLATVAVRAGLQPHKAAQQAQCPWGPPPLGRNSGDHHCHCRPWKLQVTVLNRCQLLQGDGTCPSVKPGSSPQPQGASRRHTPCNPGPGPRLPQPHWACGPRSARWAVCPASPGLECDLHLHELMEFGPLVQPVLAEHLRR